MSKGSSGGLRLRAQRKRHWRWLLALALLAILVTTVPPFILSAWGPHILGRKLSALLQTAVTVQRVSGGWWGGLVIHQLVVSERPTPETPVLMRVDHLAVNRALVPLLLSSQPVAVAIDGVSIHLRQRDDGQWNVAALLSDRGTAPSVPSDTTAPSPLPHRQADVTVTRGRLHLGRDGPTYTFAASAGSLALDTAPVQWQMALAGAARASLTVKGEIQNIAGPEPRVGHVDVSMTQLDFALITTLIPQLAAVQPHGRVQNAQVHLALHGDQRLAIEATLDLRQVQVHGLAKTAAAGIEQLQVRLQGQVQGQQWSCDTLSVIGPGVRVTLHDRAWLHVDQAAWRGHLALTLHVADMQPVTQALALRLPGGLQMAGSCSARNRS